MSIFLEDKNSIHAKAYYKFVEKANKVEMSIKRALKPFGITHAQLNVLYHLAQSSPGMISAGELKRKLLVNNPDLTRLVDRLVQKGLVIRKTCAENRRQVDITISPKGLKVFFQAHEEAKRSVNNFFRMNIEAEEAQKLFSILDKIDLSQGVGTRNGSPIA
jgi:DNA-binding MarR family transcriptional regulator